MVLEQLLFSGVLEAVHIRQQGYASRLSNVDFLSRYASLAAPSAHQRNASELASHLNEKLSLDIEVGKTKVFMKANAANALEKQRGLKRAQMATKLQAIVRARFARHRFTATRPTMKALMDCLRRIDWDTRKPEKDQPIPLLVKLGADARAFSVHLEQAEKALPHLPCSDRLRSISQAASSRLAKELQCMEQLEALAKSTDAVEIEKALARATSLQLPPTSLTQEHLPLRCKALQVQVPLVEALHAASDEKNLELLIRIIEEVNKKGLKLDPTGWLPELAVGELLRQVDAQRLKHEAQQKLEAETRQRQQQQEQEQQQRQQQQRLQQQQQQQQLHAQPAPATTMQPAPVPTSSTEGVSPVGRLPHHNACSTSAKCSAWPS